MRVAAGLFAGVFVLAAVVQWNDPDPIRWILAYLVVAGLSGAAAAGRSLLVPSVLAALLFGLWFLWLAPTLVGADADAFRSFQMRAKNHEQPREAVGLALCAGWCAALAWHAKRGQEAA